MGASRDYYADLELPATADIADIRKQFRKLALIYHPDRNPGREQEVNVRFQIIQSAHEILSDPERKATYDASRGRSSRYPGASGVRGNPWQDVGSQFPPPPRRNNAKTQNPPSGAQRWNQRFANGVPPTAKQQTTADQEARKNAARVFENSRKGQAQSSSRPGQAPNRPSAQPPPPPPRTEGAKHRAEAAFGARRSSYYSRPTTADSDPRTQGRPAGSNATQAEAVPTPRRRRPVPARPSSYRDEEDRQSTPYTTQGGERTNPFDGVPISRTKSYRDTGRRDDLSSSDDRSPADSHRRSSSAPKPAESEATAQREDDRPYASDQSNSANYPGASSNGTGAFAGQTPTNRASEGQRPSMYEPLQNSFSFRSPPYDADCTYHSLPLDSDWTPKGNYISYAAESTNGSPSSAAPSGAHLASLKVAAFERQQHKLLDRLINHVKTSSMSLSRQQNISSESPDAKDCANRPCSTSFRMPAENDEAFAHTPPDPSRFTRASFDDIDTKFANDDASSTWQFNAGGAEQDGYPSSRSQSGGRGRHSPAKRPTMSRQDDTTTNDQPRRSEGAFDPEGWTTQFGPEMFAPQPEPGAAGSPTRASRKNSKKTKAAKPTVGSAAVVDETSSGDEAFEWRGRRAQAAGAPVESPQAMDIDSPSPGPAAASPTMNGARNIPVEPSRPEWRSGNAEGMNGEKQPVDADNKHYSTAAAGSEDTDEFRASFADFKNVPPFNQPATGLKSFSDMKDTLPFESRAGDDVRPKVTKPTPLVFPLAPAAPRLPPTAAVSGLQPNMPVWTRYLEEFQTYLQAWETFNGQVVDHFSTRQKHIRQTRSAKGYGFLGVRDEVDVQEYYNWVQQDNDVRRRWNAACEEHEQRFREFMAFREKMR